MKKIHILGNLGNMGRRYAAILKYLDCEVTGHDLNSGYLEREQMKHADGFIICTPTDNHLEDIRLCFEFQKPILCEKPLTKRIYLLDDFEDENRPDLSLLTMVNQYNYLVKAGLKGQTYYDYWNSGKDGIAWDTINIFGLSTGIVRIKNQSPAWNVLLNGRKLNIERMDYAYIEMVEDWLERPESNYAYARKAHEKVHNWLNLQQGNKID